MGFRATLNFRKFNMVLNPMYRTSDTMIAASIDKERL